MESKHVFDRRRFFTPLLCRQIVWAFIEDGRSYFTQRMSRDDFLGVHPDDIIYPRSSILEIEPNIRHQTPIQRSSFPPAWITGPCPGLPDRAPGIGARSQLTPIHSFALTAPSVVSALTTGSATPSQSGRPPGQIRTTNIHPAIKAFMEPYIHKFQNVRLNQLLQFANLTVDDLPTLPPTVNTGTNGTCYNFVLGKCTLPSCQHKDGHVNATDVTDEFATAIITKLRPAVTKFLTNGAPKTRKRRFRQQ